MKVKDVLSEVVAEPKPISLNIIKEERKALQDFTNDDSHIAFTADGGVALVFG